MVNHLAKVHQNAASAKAPIRRSAGSANMARSGVSSRIVSGRDVIGTTSVSSGSIAGFEVMRIYLNPRVIVGSRLYQESKLWSRWKPIKLSLEVHTSASSIVSGLYCAAWTPDTMLNLPGGANSIKALATFSATKEAATYVPIKLNIPCDSSRKWYTFDSEDKSDNDHGIVIIILSSPIGGVSGYVQFTAHLQWTVQFDGPEMELEKGQEYIYADDSYCPYFSDSSSDFAEGKYLTFKHKEGGSVVPFPSARHGVVYKCTVDIPYKSGSTDKKTSFAVRAVEYSEYPILVLFKDQADAGNYIKTSKIEYALPYSAAGSWVTSTNPAWVAMTKYEAPGWTNRPVRSLMPRGSDDRPIASPSTSSDRIESLLERLVLSVSELNVRVRTLEVSSAPVLDGFEVITSKAPN